MSIDFSLYKTEPVCIFESNSTHNVSPMWHLAGIYDDIYNSEGKKASEVVENLKAGLEKMIKDPSAYKKLNPENGWGSYDTALRFLNDIIRGCQQNPDAEIKISK